MSKTTATVIGPDDVGRRMALDEFIDARGEGGRLYELSRGIVTMVDAPSPRHFKIIDSITLILARYRDAHPGVIHGVAAGGGSRLLIKSRESDRHPDLAVYKTPPPDSERADEIWSRWIPAIVVEVVSPSSRHRDLHQKPEEYLEFGVQEYWIIDADAKTMTVLARDGQRWARRVVKPPEVHRPEPLPGLEFAVADVFEGA